MTQSGWDQALAPGVLIGRFELVREVGRGGFGVVWEARDRDLGRRVAFKAVQAGSHPGAREEQLLAEAEAAARLQHPNIVTLHDVGRSEHGPYLILELLQGKTLAERLGQGTLPVREALRIGVEVAKGLAHAHSHGVVHRDLKPENVFLSDDGQVKVLDFGLAHAFGRRRTDGGTPSHMAPEQLEGAPEDERTDVFALGVILFEMLSGRLPFADERALRSPGAAPALDVPGAPAVGELVGRMLEKRPVDRPRDGGEVLSALSSFSSELERAPPAAGRVRTRRRPRLRGWIPAAIGIVLAAAAAGAWWSARGDRSGSKRSSSSGPVTIASVPEPSRGGAAPSTGERGAAPARPSIAVLPFADMSPRKDQEYFADGIAEEILNALAQVEGLHVTGRTSSFAFKGRNEDLRTIGQRLNVSTLLEGSVRKEGQRVRITAEIVDVADGYRLWSKTFDREYKGIFAVQEEIARAVVQALQVKLLPGMQPSMESSATSHPEAHTQFLIGDHLLRSGVAEDMRRAIVVLDKAIAIDPSYAPAWARLATALRNLAFLTRDREGEDLRRRALSAAEKSVEVGPNYGLAYTTRAWIRILDEWDWAGAQTDIDRALAISPGHFEVHNVYGMLLADQGRLAEGVAQTRTALELDPYSSVLWGNLGGDFTELGDFDHAREAFARALGLSPNNSFVEYKLAFLDVLDGRPGAALAAFERTTDTASRLRGIAIAQHALGHRRESELALGELVTRAGRYAPYFVAQVHAWRGDRDRAFEWLERAYAQRDPSLGAIKTDPFLHALHGDARFTALLRRMKLPTD